MTEYRVALDVYQGPLDLLLFLIKREEVDIHDIPIARITAQYIAYVDLLRQLDPEVVSEFLVLAATLMEIKSRALLPRPPALDTDDEIVDPRLELVRQLLEYKKYKDAARALEEAATERAQQHERRPVLPDEPRDEIELENLEIWDLFDAFNRLLEQIGKAKPVHQVGVDDTPMALHAEDILDSIQRAGGIQPFEEIFAGRIRAEMIGLFLALLELIRQQRIQVSQDRPFGVILIHLLDPTPLGRVGKEPAEYAAEPEEHEGASAEAPLEPAPATAGPASLETDPTDQAVFPGDLGNESNPPLAELVPETVANPENQEAPSNIPMTEPVTAAAPAVPAEAEIRDPQEPNPGSELEPQQVANPADVAPTPQETGDAAVNPADDPNLEKEQDDDPQ